MHHNFDFIFVCAVCLFSASSQSMGSSEMLFIHLICVSHAIWKSIAWNFRNFSKCFVSEQTGVKKWTNKFKSNKRTEQKKNRKKFHQFVLRNAVACKIQPVMTFRIGFWNRYTFICGISIKINEKQHVRQSFNWFATKWDYSLVLPYHFDWYT